MNGYKTTKTRPQSYYVHIHIMMHTHYYVQLLIINPNLINKVIA